MATKETFWQKLLKEVKLIIGMSLYFMVPLGILMVLKRLILENYHIEFTAATTLVIGGLIMAKVVLLMELIPLGKWIRRQPPFVNILVRTVLYTFGVWIVLLLEKSFEHRHEDGGFTNALKNLFSNRNIYQVWAGTIVTSLSILSFNILSVLQKYLGKNQLAKLFFTTPLEQVDIKK